MHFLEHEDEQEQEQEWAAGELIRMQLRVCNRRGRVRRLGSR